MTERCDFSDLPTDQCGHCNGAEERAIEAPPQRWEGSQTEARFPGSCGHCGQRYPEGALIVAADVDGNGASAAWCLLEHTVGSQW